MPEVPAWTLDRAIRAFDSLLEIIDCTVDLPEGECRCSTMSMPPCGFCENNGHWKEEIQRAEAAATLLSSFLDNHIEKQDQERLKKQLEELAEEEDRDGFGSY